jgi:hypothetical protein
MGESAAVAAMVEMEEMPWLAAAMWAMAEMQAMAGTGQMGVLAEPAAWVEPAGRADPLRYRFPRAVMPLLQILVVMAVLGGPAVPVGWAEMRDFPESRE